MKAASTLRSSRTIVIGAGLSGLAAAIQLSNKGREVVVLEAQNHIGGCCSTLIEGGFTFNNGAVYLAVPSLIRKAFERLGLDFDLEVPTVAIDRPQFALVEGRTQVHLSTAETSYVEGNASTALSSQLRDGLGALHKDWGPFYRSLVRDVLPHGPSNFRTLQKLWRHLPKLRGSAASVITKYFPEPDLQAAVAATLLYSGIDPEILPASQMIGLVAMLEEGFYLPANGMGAISDALESQLRRNAVEVRRNAEVTEILAGPNGVSGVMLSTGEQIEGASVLASTSGFSVVERLLNPSSVPRRLEAKSRTAPLSHRGVSIQVGLSSKTHPEAFIVNDVPSMPRQKLVHQLPTETPTWIAYTNPTMVVPSLAPDGKSIVELFAPATGINSVADWTTEMTHQVVDGYLNALLDRLPGLRLDWLRVSDPPAFERRMLFEGALYGIAPGASPADQFPYRTGIEGLFLCGQTTYPGYGVGPAIFSGIHAASEIAR